MTSKTADRTFWVLEVAIITVVLILFTARRNVDVHPNQALIDYMTEEYDYTESFMTDEYQVFAYKVRNAPAKPDRADIVYIVFPRGDDTTPASSTDSTAVVK